MGNLKKKIQAYLDDNYSPNLDSYDDDDLRHIDDFLNELNKSGHNHRISKLLRNNNKLEIETKSGTAYIRKK
jgi:hypothetical protein